MMFKRDEGKADDVELRVTRTKVRGEAKVSVRRDLFGTCLLSFVERLGVAIAHSRATPSFPPH